MTVTEPLPVVDAVRRELELDEQSREGRRRVRAVLTLTTNIDRSPAQLWPLLTRPAQLGRWFGPVSGELGEGGSFRAPHGASGRILQAAEPHRLSLTWDQGRGEEPLQIRSDPEDDGTSRLQLRSTVLVDAQEFARHGPGALAISWELALLALAAHTDGWRSSCLTPAPLPTPEWLHSAQGAEYVRAWSVRWAAQAIAAGVDETTARRGETETTRQQLKY